MLHVKNQYCPNLTSVIAGNYATIIKCDYWTFNFRVVGNI